MSTKSAALPNEVLALPTDERAEITAGLLASLDDAGAGEDSEQLDAMWADEMSRRSQQLASGEVQPETWDDVARRVAEGRALGELRVRFHPFASLEARRSVLVRRARSACRRLHRCRSSLRLWRDARHQVRR